MSTSTRRVSLDEAPPLLAELVRLTQGGTQIVITDAGVPVARLVPADPSDGPRIAGLNEGEAWISDDFDAELPDEFWLGKE
jgi:prevent-host-death family protein